MIWTIHYWESSGYRPFDRLSVSSELNPSPFLCFSVFMPLNSPGKGNHPKIKSLAAFQSDLCARTVSRPRPWSVVWAV